MVVTLSNHPKPANDKGTFGTLIPTSHIGSVGMSNVLSEDKKQQIIALGKLGWTLRRIEQATGVRRETAGAYLKGAGIAVRPPGAWGRRSPAKPANEVITDSDSKPANEVITGFCGGFPLNPGLQARNRTPSLLLISFELFSEFFFDLRWTISDNAKP